MKTVAAELLLYHFIGSLHQHHNWRHNFSKSENLIQRSIQLMHTGDVVILVLSRYDRMLVKSLVIKVVYGLRHKCYDLLDLSHDHTNHVLYELIYQ